MKRLFISHITEETTVAAGLKHALEQAFQDVEVFVSAEDIEPGTAWLEALDNGLKRADGVLVLCSSRSTPKPWVNFESGAGWGRGVQVIPICHGGLTKQDLPYPLSILQGLTLRGGVAGSKDILEELGRALGLSLRKGAGLDAWAKTLAGAAAERAGPNKDVGIVLTARQDEWRRGSIFDLLDDKLPERLGSNWPIAFVHDAEKLRLDRIGEFPGLIVGSPWRASLSADEVDAMTQYVHRGGRMLLLGYELGDRHHGGNLSAVARQFGIYPSTDIIGPTEHPEKPYDVPVVFRVDLPGTHPMELTKGLESLRLNNVQSLRVEPGGVEWLRVGSNASFRPMREKVRYAEDGTLTSGKEEFEANPRSDWLAVGVKAPQGLCGSGEVLALGTWDLLGPGGAFLEHDDNAELVRRLFDWLAGA